VKLEDARIGVLMGGISAEREISLKSGAAVSGALKSMGLNVVEIDAGHDVSDVLGNENIDLAFVVLHGGYGENGAIQGLLEVQGIPYTGSGIMASAIAMDKLVSKTMFKNAGLSVPDYIEVDEAVSDIPIKLPVVVKPSREGSSIGVAIVNSSDELAPALKAALAFEGPALVERYVKGRDVQIAVLNNRALGGVEVRPKGGFYSYEAKYTSGMTDYVIPPEIDGELYDKAMEVGLAAHNAIGASGATRVDLMIDEKDNIYVLEVNTIPGMTETSLLPKIAQHAGMDMKALVEAMAQDGLKRLGGDRP